MSEVAILWDASHLWGLMAHRAMAALGVPHCLIMAQEIAQGALFRKRPAILLVPGGSARQKSIALGASGREAVRRWVARGGFYLGFCGGAGLALADGRENGPQSADAGLSLGLCPWRRLGFRDRLYHLISGHVLAATVEGSMRLPLWWPGRFAEASGQVQVLARYTTPAADFWLADMPLVAIPAATMKASGLLAPGQPLVVSGNYGDGAYVLSYAHLETPDSPDANRWLAQILARNGLAPRGEVIPPWPLEGEKGKALELWEGTMALGRRLGFFLPRAPWLQSWRRGVPGMGCNHLLACLYALVREDATIAPHPRREDLETLLGVFCRETEACLWCMARGEDPMTGEWNRLFGHPMLGGGQIHRLLSLLEGLLYAGQEHLLWELSR